MRKKKLLADAPPSHVFRRTLAYGLYYSLTTHHRYTCSIHLHFLKRNKSAKCVLKKEACKWWFVANHVCDVLGTLYNSRPQRLTGYMLTAERQINIIVLLLEQAGLLHAWILT